MVKNKLLYCHYLKIDQTFRTFYGFDVVRGTPTKLLPLELRKKLLLKRESHDDFRYWKNFHFRRRREFQKIKEMNLLKPWWLRQFKILEIPKIRILTTNERKKLFDGVMTKNGSLKNDHAAYFNYNEQPA